MKRIVMVIIAIAIPLIVGGISAGLSAKGMSTYGEMTKPPLSPPAWVFSVAWTILYIVMGYASYLVVSTQTDARNKFIAICIYLVQLAMNFGWSLIFFNKEAYIIAFFWLMILWALVIFCAFRFYLVNSVAAYLMVPYIIWLTFAAYLNFGTALIKLRG